MEPCPDLGPESWLRRLAMPEMGAKTDQVWMYPLQSGMYFIGRLMMEVLELKRDVEQLSKRLGKTQEYL